MLPRQRVLFPLFALLLAAALAPLSGGPGQDPEPALDPVHENEAASVLLAPFWLEETSHFIRVNNTGETDVPIQVVFSGGDPDYDGFFSKLAHHFTETSNVSYGATGYGWDRAIVELRYEDTHLSVGPPISTIPVIFGYFPLNMAISIDLVPGVQHLLLSAQGPGGYVSIVAEETPTHPVQLETVLTDPGMSRWMFTHVKGHWDEVSLEVWTAAGGYVQARTTETIRHTRSSIWAGGPGIGEVTITDANGVTCSSKDSPGLLAPLLGGAWLLQPAPGPAQVEIMLAQHVGVHGRLMLLDVPLPPMHPETWCFGFDDESTAVQAGRAVLPTPPL